MKPIMKGIKANKTKAIMKDIKVNPEARKLSLKMTKMTNFFLIKKLLRKSTFF